MQLFAVVAVVVYFMQVLLTVRQSMASFISGQHIAGNFYKFAQNDEYSFFPVSIVNIFRPYIRLCYLCNFTYAAGDVQRHFAN